VEGGMDRILWPLPSLLYLANSYASLKAHLWWALSGLVMWLQKSTAQLLLSFPAPTNHTVPPAATPARQPGAVAVSKCP
jgi:hypothetical protein